MALFGMVMVWQTFSGFIFEDAYITYRYADKIASGSGFVFTEGERVLGTTTPLYTLILAALGFLGADIPFASGLIFSCSAGLVGLLGGLIIRRSGTPILAIVFALFASSGGPEIYRFFGLETPFLSALLIGATWAAINGRTTLGAVLVAFAFLTRYDAALFAILYFALTWIRDRKLPLRPGILAAAIVLPWLIFAQWYFGSVLPNTLGAKTGDTEFSTYFVGAIERQWKMCRWYLSAAGLLDLLGGTLGVVVAWVLSTGAALALFFSILRKEILTLLLLFYPVALLLGYSLIGPNLNFLWYSVPGTYCVVLFALIGLGSFTRWLRIRVLTELALVPVVALGASVIPSHLSSNFDRFVNGSQYRFRVEAYREMAEFVRASGLSDESLLTPEPGYFAYLSDNPAIDQAGLVTKGIYFHGEESRRSTRQETIDEFHPALIVSQRGRPPEGYLPAYVHGTKYELLLREDVYAEHIDSIRHGAADSQSDAVAEIESPFEYRLDVDGQIRWVTEGGISAKLGNPVNLLFDGVPTTGLFMFADPVRRGAESPSFLIDFNTVEFLLAAKPHPMTGAQLIVDGQPVLTAAGSFSRSNPSFEQVVFDVSQWRGKVASLQFFQWSDHRHLTAFDRIRSGRDASRRVLEDFESGPRPELWESTFTDEPASLRDPAMRQGAFVLTSDHAATSFGLEGTHAQRSLPFLLDEDQLRFRMLDFGDEQVSVGLVVNGEVVRQVQGVGSNASRGIYWDITDLRGQTARLEILDDAPAAAIWVGIDDITLATPGLSKPH